MRRNKRRIALVAGLLAGALSAGTVLAEDIWVKSETVEIRSGKGAVYPVIATKKKGDSLAVVSREPKGWIKVKVGEQEGYVFESAISAQKVSGGGNLLSQMGAGDAGNIGTAAAGRGLNKSAEEYAASKNMDPKLLDRLIAFRKKIDPSQWEKFTADGKVGPDAQ